MNYVNTPFGFSTTLVGNVAVYSCKLRINRVSKSIEKHITALATAIPYALFTYDSLTAYWQISYSLVDCKKADYAQHSIGFLLKAHALDKLEAKYDWLDRSKSFIYSKTMGALNTTPMSKDPQQASYDYIRELIEQFEFSTGDSDWPCAMRLVKQMEDGTDTPGKIHTELALKMRALKEAVTRHIHDFPYDIVKIYEDMYRAKITALHYGKVEYDDLILEMGVKIPYFFGGTPGLPSTDDWERNIISDARRKQLHPEYGTFEV